MIQEKEIEIKIYRGYVNYYLDKGYEIKKNKKGKYNKYTKLKIKTEDLPPNSRIKIHHICKYCNKISYISYQTYNLKIIKEACHICAMKYFFSGENSPFYNHNLTTEVRINRRLIYENKIFTQSVLKRDNYKCFICKTHRNLEVHHLESYKLCKEKRTDVENGITLCHDCHFQFHKIYGYKNISKDVFLNYCNISDLNLKCELVKIEPEKKVICYENGIIYDSCRDAAIELKLDVFKIKSVCCHKKSTDNFIYRTTGGLHFFFYDEFQKMSEKEIENYVKTKQSKCKKIKCLDTDEIFLSIRAASIKYNTRPSEIIKRLKKQISSSYKNIPINWIYL